MPVRACSRRGRRHADVLFRQQLSRFGRGLMADLSCPPVSRMELRINSELVALYVPGNSGDLIDPNPHSLAVAFDSTHFGDRATVTVQFDAWIQGQHLSGSGSSVNWNRATAWGRNDFEQGRERRPKVRPNSCRSCDRRQPFDLQHFRGAGLEQPPAPSLDGSADRFLCTHSRQLRGKSCTSGHCVPRLLSSSTPTRTMRNYPHR